MKSKQLFRTRFGFLSATIGQALGTGNIWRFPQIAAANGGGPFVIAYIIALLVWAIPLLMAEAVIGRKFRKGTAGVFRDLIGEKFTWMGGWIVAVCFALSTHYAVTASWSLRYIIYGFTGVLKPGLDTQVLWDNFLASPGQCIVFHAIAVALAAWVSFRSIQRGIEKVSKVLVPVIYALLALVMIRTVTLPGATMGLHYLYNFEFSILSGRVWLEAFTHVALSAGAGWGLMMTYAVYTKEKENVACNSFIIGLANVSAALMAVIPIMQTLAPSNVDPVFVSQNPGLTFDRLAKLFHSMPGGTVFATLFFLAVFFAALTSLYALYEVTIRNFTDIGWSRKKSAVWVVVLSFLCGIPSVINTNFFISQNQVWGSGLLVSGLLVSVGIQKYGLKRARLEDINSVSGIKVGKWWDICIRISPIWFLMVLGWRVYGGFSRYPDTWWNPFELYSPAALITQWFIIFLILLVYNKIIAESIKPSV